MQEHDEASLEALGTTMLRQRRPILTAGAVGAIAGVVLAIAGPRQYDANVTFIPQSSSETSLPSGLALAANQFGIQLPGSGGGSWGPPVYVDLLQSAAFLGSVALDTETVAEMNGQRIPLMDLLEIPLEPAARRVERTVVRLRKMILAIDDKNLNGVQLTVTTPWPSVSLALAERLVSGVSQFNVETRRSQAKAERQFVEAQAHDAADSLHDAEERLLDFLRRNHSVVGSPDLEFARDRLQRDVTLRQTVYASLMQNEEEARIREVRDTPVITLLESPHLPASPKSRGTILKTGLGAFGGMLLATLVAVIGEAIASARATTGPSQEFYRLLAEATPRFLRRPKA